MPANQHFNPRNETGSQCHPEAVAEGSLFVSVGKERFFAGAQNDICARPAILDTGEDERGGFV